MLLDYLDDALFSTPEWGRVPGWVQAKVQTISSERSKMLYYDVRHPDQGDEPSNCLVWRLRDNQNPTELVANLDGLPDEIWGKGRIEGTYVWLLTGTPWRPWSKVS